MNTFLPGIVFTPAAIASLLDSSLSPIPVIAVAFGPMNATPTSSNFLTNSAFSDKNPYPG